MITNKLKNAVDIQRNGNRVLNVIKGDDILFYYIPDSYVELEYIIDLNNNKHYIESTKNSNNVFIEHKVPVRRLGDAICGLFDTISQKFYPSESNIPFKGGPVRFVEKEWVGVTTNGKTPNYQKNVNVDRIKKSFICNALWFNIRTIDSSLRMLHTCRESAGGYRPEYGAINPSGTSDKENNSIFVDRGPSYAASYIINVNPNWVVVKTDNVTVATSTYETNNATLLKYGNITIIPPNVKVTDIDSSTTYSTITKGLDVNNALQAFTYTGTITMTHLPYLEFTGTEADVIQLAPCPLNVYSRIYCCFMPKGTLKEEAGCVYGNMQDDENDAPGTTIHINNYISVNGYSTDEISTNIYEDQWIISDVQYTGPRAYVNDTVSKGAINTTYHTYDNFTLGGAGIYQNVEHSYFPFKGRIKYLRIEGKDYVQLHFLPVRVVESSTKHVYYGFFETKTRRLYLTGLTGNVLPAYEEGYEGDDNHLININGDIITV